MIPSAPVGGGSRLSAFVKEEEWWAVMVSLRQLLDVIEPDNKGFATLYFPLMACFNAMLRVSLLLSMS